MSAVIIRSNAKGTVNRAQLRKLVEAGQLEGRTWYHYDETTVTTASTAPAWLPVRLKADGGDFKDDHVNLDAEDLGAGHARAYIDDARRLKLRIHSNLVYELRVVDKRPAPAPPKLAKAQPTIRVIRRELLETACRILKENEDLIAESLRDLGCKSYAVDDVQSAIRHIVDDDFRSSECAGGS